jgi:mono/diheme cytochrome c family protein
MSLRIHALLGIICLALTLPLTGQGPAKSAGDKKPPASGKPGAASVKAGQSVYATYCAICHLPTSTEKKIGPGLKGLVKREKFSSGEKITDESLRAWIEKGGKDMPAFKQTLTPEQIRDVIAYVKTL